MTLTTPYPRFSLAQLLQPLTRFFDRFRDAEDEEEEEIVDSEKDEIDDRDQEGLFDRLFGDGDFVPKSQKPDDEKPEEEEEEEEEEKPEDEEEEDPGEEEEEEEDEDKEEEETDEEEEKDEDYEDDGENTETIAQRDAKALGREVRTLKSTNADLLLEKNAAQAELDEARKQIADFTQLTVDPKSNPEYQKLNNQMWDDVDSAAAEELPVTAGSFPERFPSYLKTYLDNIQLRGDERTAATQELKGKMVEELGGFDVPYSEMDGEEKLQADTLTKDALAVLRRNAPRAQELLKLENSVRDQAKKGRVAVGVREYEDRKKLLSPVLSKVGEMDEKLIKENPYSPEAILTDMAKESPVVKKRLVQARRDVLEVFTGLRPLTKDEYDELEGQDIDLKKFQKDRVDAHNLKREKLARILVQVLPTLSITNKSLRKTAEEARKQSEEDDDLEILGKVDRKRAKAPAKKKSKPKAPPIPAHERPSAIDQYLDPE